MSELYILKIALIAHIVWIHAVSRQFRSPERRQKDVEKNWQAYDNGTNCDICMNTKNKDTETNNKNKSI